MLKNFVTFPLYIPRIWRTWTNWPEYLLNYVSRGTRPAEYHTRDGFRLVDAEGALPGTIAVVFVRQEYGQLGQFRTIVDIGAHRGTFAVHAAQFCPDARIYCYEPEHRNFDILRQNIRVNGLEGRICAFHRAVGSTGGPRDLAVGESLLNSFHIIPEGARRQTVDCITLKDIFAEHRLETIDLLKMNCEGAEYEILESCSRAQFDRIASIRLEYHNLNASHCGESLTGFLKTRGYRIERFTRYLKPKRQVRSGFIWAARSTLLTLCHSELLAFI